MGFAQGLARLAGQVQRLAAHVGGLGAVHKDPGRRGVDRFAQVDLEGAQHVGEVDAGLAAADLQRGLEQGLASALAIGVAQAPNVCPAVGVGFDGLPVLCGAQVHTGQRPFARFPVGDAQLGWCGQHTDVHLGAGRAALPVADGVAQGVAGLAGETQCAVGLQPGAAVGQGDGLPCSAALRIRQIGGVA